MRFSEIKEALRTGERDLNAVNSDDFQIGVEIEFLAMVKPDSDGFHPNTESEAKKIALSFKRILGLNIEYKSVFATAPNKIEPIWKITTDGSVHPIKDNEQDKSYEDYEYAGLEIVSPPMSFADYEKWVPRVFHWMNDNKFITNGSTGFHINMSFKDKNKMNKIDPLKITIFSGGDYLKTIFKRAIDRDYRGNIVDYIKGNISRYKQAIQHRGELPTINSKTVEELKKLFTGILNKDTHIHAPTPMWLTKRHTVNLANLAQHGYIEFRVVGGENYHNRWPEILNTTKRFMKALEESINPGTDKELAKKLYKIFQEALAESPIEWENDSPMVKLNDPSLKALLPKFSALLKNNDITRRIYNLLKIYDIKGGPDGNWQLLYDVIQLLQYNKNEATSPSVRSGFIALVRKYNLTYAYLKDYYERNYYDYDPEYNKGEDDDDEYWGDKRPSDIPLKIVARYLMLK